MKKKDPFKYLKTSPEIIRLAVMLYVRFPLSLRNVEDLLHECGIDVSHETRSLAACPPVVEYSREFQARAAEEMVTLPEGFRPVFEGHALRPSQGRKSIRRCLRVTAWLVA